MYLLQCVVYALLLLSTLVAMRLPVYLCEGAARDREDSLFTTTDTEHQGFSYAATNFSSAWPHPLLNLDAVSLWSSPESNYKMADGEEFVISL